MSAYSRGACLASAPLLFVLIYSSLSDRTCSQLDKIVAVRYLPLV